MILERYYLNQLPFKYTLTDQWLDAEEFISYCQTRHIPPLARLILLSDGSLVKHLKALHLSDISVEVKEQRQANMDIEMAKFLDATEGLNGVVRDAWLCCKGQKLVYAHSFIDASRMGEMIQRGIHKKNTPVGMLLSDYSLPLIRDQLFISQLRSNQMAREFKITENTFWVRCYRLRGGEGFNAAILEIFSQDMFDIIR